MQHHCCNGAPAPSAAGLSRLRGALSASFLRRSEGTVFVQPLALPHHGAKTEILVADDQIGAQAGAQRAGAVTEAEHASRGGARRRGYLGDRQARGDGVPDDAGHGGGRAGDRARCARLAGSG